MRISDWSSDVCSSDLDVGLRRPSGLIHRRRHLWPPARMVSDGPLLILSMQEGRLHALSHECLVCCGAVFRGRARGDGEARPGRSPHGRRQERGGRASAVRGPLSSPLRTTVDGRSDEHTTELQSLMRISYAVFCLKKKTTKTQPTIHNYSTLLSISKD